MADETYDEVNSKIKGEGVENELSTIEEKEAIETNEIVVDIEDTAETLPVQSVAKVALKKKPSCRDKLRDKVTCPKCGKELSRHSYDYTHSKFCKGRKPLVPTDDEGEEGLMKTSEKISKLTSAMKGRFASFQASDIAGLVGIDKKFE